MLTMMKNLSADARYRWEITFRVLTAIFGGYALTITSGILLAYILPMNRSDSVTTAMLLSFAIYAGAVMWIFSQCSVRKAVAGIWISTAIFTALITLLKLLGVTP